MTRSLALALLSLTVASAGLAGRDGTRVKAALEGTGALPGARGDVKLKIKEPRPRFQLRARGLTPAQSYTLTVGGVEVASGAASSSGALRLRFRGPDGGGSQLPLDFDPRGAVIALRDGVGDVLAVDLDAPISSESEIRMDERTRLAVTLVGSPGTAKARFRIRKQGRQSFEVEVEDALPGDYALFVDGIARAIFPVNSLGEGEVEFDTRSQVGKLPLDFDPRGATLDVVREGEIVLSGPMTPSISGVDTCAPSEVERFLTPTTAAGAGKAKARLRRRSDCDRDLRVEVEDVPEGSYALRVGGVDRGTIVVAFDPTSGENEGQIEFDSDPDESDELLLDFEAEGQPLEVLSGVTLFFSSEGIDLGSPGAPGDPGPGTCSDSEQTELLVAAAGFPSAKGEVRFRTRSDCDRDLRIEIEDVPEGSYDVLIGGVQRGVIAAAFNASAGEIEGQIEFDTDVDEPGEVLLDFDPEGQPVEIRASGALVLSSDGVGDPPGSPATCEESQVELPLLAVGPVPAASGEVRLRVRDDCRESFRVQAEDLPVGSYDLVVGGSVRGTIAVQTSGSGAQGEIEFDTDDPPKPVLDFDPRGQLVEVTQGSTVFLSRSLPQ